MTNRQAAIQVVKGLQRSGFEALLAGGCVRDMLLRRRAKDYDVATDAQPVDVARLFHRTLKVGAKFGVVIVLLKDQQVEVATFRSEGAYADGRHPTQVQFVGAAEDASRRDFTINGMFYDPLADRVIDCVGGRDDLEDRVIRTIGDPNERFGEDYLRMLRAVRFSTQLGFEIEPATFAAVRRNAGRITRISGERIRIELEAILVNPNRAAGARTLVQGGLAGAIFPDLTADDTNCAVGVLKRLRKKVDFPLALAGFFAAMRTDVALASCRVLKLSRRQTKHLKFLLANRGKLLDHEMALSRLKTFLAGPYFWDLYELEKAIQRNMAGRKGVMRLARLGRRIGELGDVEIKPKPLLNGHDLIRLGATRGPSLGQLAEELYIAQLEGVVQSRRQAEDWAHNWMNKRAEAQT